MPTGTPRPGAAHKRRRTAICPAQSRIGPPNPANSSPFCHLTAALPRNDPKRGPELLHVTLMSLFDLHQAPSGWLSAVIAAFDAFAGDAFPLAFDRIEERKAVTLRTRAPLPEARAFQAALVRVLVERRAPIMLDTTPEPHLTISYRGDGLGARKIEPIGWMVEEILLIESVVGKATHTTHGRWPLRARRGDPFA